MSRWHKHLRDGETLCWEGRPAPRAFVFRRWLWSVGTLLVGLAAVLCATLVVFRVGPTLQVNPRSGALLLLGLLFFWGTFGHLFYARLAWENEFYALTDSRLLVKSGLFGCRVWTFDRKDLAGVALRSMGASLATVSLGRRAGGRPVRLHCLEHPELLLEKLSEVAK